MAAFDQDALPDGPLTGLRVLDVTKVWAGPMATALLADLGADVIRVEMPGNREGLFPPEIPGTGLAWFRQTTQRGKRSLALDLRAEGAADTLLGLVADVDVLVENYLPGTLARLGLGYARCREVNPGLVYVSISGFGQYGPQSRRPGYDPIIQAASGWMALNGEPGGRPLRSPTFIADDLAALYAVIGALSALRHRDATGEGQHVDVALLDALLATSDGYLTLAAAGAQPGRQGDQTDMVVPAGVFRCADDAYVYLAAALDKHWRLFAQVIDRPELARAPGYATNAERVANREAVNAVIGAWCATRTADEVQALLDARGLTAQRVRDLAEAAKDPHVLERGMLCDTTLSNGTVAPLTGPAIKFSRTPARIRSGAPEPGAHTGEILADPWSERRRTP